tara:strand:- start:10162 stop:10659 length:498 start_codon:yes stop_codon:yes gene_type:complete
MPTTTSTPETVNTQPTTTASTVSESLTALIETVSQQQQTFRELHKNLKKLEKEVIREHKRLSKVTRPRRVVVQKPVQVNDAMREFITKYGGDIAEEHADGGWTRQVMMKIVSTYIRTVGKLQLDKNKKHWKSDKCLRTLFALDKKTLYTFMNINGLISRVVVKKD